MNQIEAIYEQGVFRPIRPIELPEQTRVRVDLTESSSGDVYFSTEEIARLSELMVRWRTARDTGSTLSLAEQSELESLVELEFNAATKRMEGTLLSNPT